MRLAIYAICKNEAAHVGRWLDAVRSELWIGDTVMVADTGSTDGTLQEFSKRGELVHRVTVSPWRFDLARNAALALVDPTADAAWALDLDEIPQPGWRQAINDAWVEGVTRLRYPYVWSWTPDGKPGITYYADKLHARTGFRWRHPCHETLTYIGEEKEAWTDRLVLHHHPDDSKSRGSYLGLMHLALQESPDDDRMQHYYARELHFRGFNDMAASWFERHLANPKATWRHERSQSMLYLARLKDDPSWASQWLYRAAAECPERREVWMALAHHERTIGNHSLALQFARRAMSIPVDRFYLSDPSASGNAPLELIKDILSDQAKSLAT